MTSIDSIAFSNDRAAAVSSSVNVVKDGTFVINYEFAPLRPIRRRQPYRGVRYTRESEHSIPMYIGAKYCLLPGLAPEADAFPGQMTGLSASEVGQSETH